MDATLLTGRLVTPDELVEEGALVVEGDRIAWAGRRAQLPDAYSGLDAEDGGDARATLLPGLVDVHCHGGAGAEFGMAGAGAAAEHHLRHGTTTLVGSLVSAPPERLLAGVAACAQLVADGRLAGIHLEGPFLSVVRCGAQDPTALTDPDIPLVEELAQAAGGALVQMTFAPERPDGTTLVAALAEHGAIGAVGHTDAEAPVARHALEVGREISPRGGRPLVTHVFNGMPPLHHRAPGPVAAALGAAARGEAVLEVVGDGTHLAADTVRMLFEVVGPDSLALITDAMAASGMPEGRYSLGGRDVVVEGRTARLVEGGSIAGGVATLAEVVRWCSADVGLPLVDVVRAASLTPATAMGWTDVGALVAGRRADVLVVDRELAPVRVMRAGAWVA